jgi:hypothetical protein
MIAPPTSYFQAFVKVSSSIPTNLLFGGRLSAVGHIPQADGPAQAGIEEALAGFRPFQRPVENPGRFRRHDLRFGEGQLIGDAHFRVGPEPRQDRLHPLHLLESCVDGPLSVPLFAVNDGYLPQSPHDGKRPAKQLLAPAAESQG